MNLKKFVIIQTLFIFFIQFPLHFLYDVFPIDFFGLFSPVNESIAEHIKMMFYAFVFGSIFFTIVFKRVRMEENFFAFLTSSILAIGLFLSIYIPFYLSFGEQMIFTFILLFIVILLSQIVCYYILFYTKMKYKKVFSFILFVFFFFLFTFFTYFPPHFSFFLDPIHNSYGILP